MMDLLTKRTVSIRSQITLVAIIVLSLNEWIALNLL